VVVLHIAQLPADCPEGFALISAYPFSTGLIILRQRYEIFNGFANKYQFLFNGLNKSPFQTVIKIQVFVE
jgi:hypothetical protein